MAVICDAYDDLVALLSEEQKAALEKYRNAKDDYNDEAIDRHFAEGFKAGVLFGLVIKE